MSIEQEKQVNSQESDLLCVSCKRFFGSPSTKQMCSQCFKQNQGLVTPKKEDKTPLSITQLNAPQEKKEEVKEKVEINKDKCATCSRKLKLLGVECRCGLFFCNGHRMPEDHACSFNHKNKDKLTKQIVKVQNGKIESI